MEHSNVSRLPKNNLSIEERKRLCEEELQVQLYIDTLSTATQIQKDGDGDFWHHFSSGRLFSITREVARVYELNHDDVIALMYRVFFNSIADRLEKNPTLVEKVARAMESDQGLVQSIRRT